MINRAVLVGRLTRDIEVKKTTSGTSVAQFTVACDRNRKKDDSSQEQQADFISCVAWRQPADFLGQYARKGSMVGIDGRIQTRNYTDKDGRTVYLTEIVAENVRLLESRKTGSDRPPVTSGSVKMSDIDNDLAKECAAEEYGIDPDELPF